MNMLAKEYISRYVHPDYQKFAQVIVSNARKGVHFLLEPDQPVPDQDPGGRGGDNTTIFIQIDTDSIPPVLIRDHNCKDGFVCGDHPEESMGHRECYGEGQPCPYPGCHESHINMDELSAGIISQQTFEAKSSEAESSGASS